MGREGGTAQGRHGRQRLLVGSFDHDYSRRGDACASVGVFGVWFVGRCWMGINVFDSGD